MVIGTASTGISIAAEVTQPPASARADASQPPAPPSPEPSASNRPAPEPATVTNMGLRLNIYRASGGTFVYKFVDPLSGKVVQQLPSEEIVRMRQSPDYAAGSLISTTA
jgi:hypothetical protein